MLTVPTCINLPESTVSGLDSIDQWLTRRDGGSDFDAPRRYAATEVDESPPLMMDFAGSGIGTRVALAGFAFAGDAACPEAVAAANQRELSVGIGCQGERLLLEWSGLMNINNVWQAEMVSGMREALTGSFIIVFFMIVTPLLCLFAQQLI